MLAAHQQDTDLFTDTEDEEELLSIIVGARLLPRFANTAFFPRLAALLLSFASNRRMPAVRQQQPLGGEIEADERPAPSLALAAASLCAAGQHLTAAALVSSALALPTSLRTTRNALALLGRYLHAHILPEAGAGEETATLCTHACQSLREVDPTINLTGLS